MSSGREIQDRIQSIKNTGKITRAMELISTVKMKKAQDVVYQARPFAIGAMRVLGRISDSIADSTYCKKPEKPCGKELIVVVTSNRGLCGGYNVNVFREIAKLQKNDIQYDFVTIGKKAREFVIRTGGNLIADYSDCFRDELDGDEVAHVGTKLDKIYLEGGYDCAKMLYSYYQSAISQVAAWRQLYPIDASKVVEFLEKIVGEEVETSSDLKYKIEPNKKAIVDRVVPLVLGLMFLEMLLEAKASEHAARMVAMKNARENSEEKVKELTLEYNKARQAAVTTEISEIVSGMESMKDL